MTYSFGNLDDVETNNFDLLPADNYKMRSIDQEMKDTRDGNGAYLAVTFEIVEGEFSGRRVWQNYNLINQNQKAVDIALGDIKAWLEACGLESGGTLTMDRINELEMKTFTGKVGVQKDKTGQYGDRNKIAGFVLSTTGEIASDSGTPPASEASGSDKRPWQQ